VVADLGPESFTAEQAVAIERREGDLVLDAGAGAGKTAVLVERFARSVLDDGIEVGRLLCITFTEKAAGELRQRIRLRLSQRGACEAARALEGAWISTIHGFCARILRTHALAAGLDPHFEVLDANGSSKLADEAFETALEELAGARTGAAALIAAHSPAALQAAIIACHAELRARGQARPSLPPLDRPPGCAAALAELDEARLQLARELGEIATPGKRVAQALERLRRCGELCASAEPSLVEFEESALPGGNGAALASATAQRYEEALARARRVREHQLAARDHALLGELLERFGERYAERKRQASAVDFEDLELLCAQLLERPELAARYRERFQRVMVDEMQDTNAVQLALIERIASGRLFTVGDAQQSIYGFRHADVELFERRGARLAARGARAALQVNFRSRPALLAHINEAFAALIEDYRPLQAGRREQVADSCAGAGGCDPELGACAVELLIADKGAEWERDGLAAPWRLAEARALAGRIAALLDAGYAAGRIAVLLRASTDMRLYEQALEHAGVGTYTIGARGYWSHPQVIDMLCYLRALANPLDEEALAGLLVCPLVGASHDALVMLVAAAREHGCAPWQLLRQGAGAIEDLDERDRRLLDRFASWFEIERMCAWRLGPAALIERAVAHADYDLAVLAMRGGERRWANVLKLLRLAFEHQSTAGPDLPGFLELARRRAAGVGGGGDREGEAPVTGDALDAVALMTIHRAKGLEFDVVCVADLGRAPVSSAPLMRVGRDGRFGVRLSEPGTGRTLGVLDYDSLAAEQRAREQAEERRLYYVAATRARDRLILSGALALDSPARAARTPMSWLARAFLGDLAPLVTRERGVAPNGVGFWIVRPQGGGESQNAGGAAAALTGGPAAALTGGPAAALTGEPAAALTDAPKGSVSEEGTPMPPLIDAPAPAPTLSYSALAEHRRCGLRFYAERVLALPPEPPQRSRLPDRDGGEREGELDGVARGTLIHELLAGLDLRRAPPEPGELASQLAGRCGEAQAHGIAEALRRFAATPMSARLARAREISREQEFAFLLGETLVRGAFDVLARERAGSLLIVDYKSDRLRGAEPEQAFAAAYRPQRLIYALAALRTGAPQVEVAHVFLEAPERPVSASFSRGDLGRLERELTALAKPLLAGSYPVCEQPHLTVCHGCPAAGGLCPHPPALTRRAAPDRLF
jgi:ATP-dependent helicase/nuclease subunit A